MTDMQTTGINQPQSQPEPAVPEQRLESFRANHPSLATRVANGELELDAAFAIADGRDSRPRSGYARLRVRHHAVIEANKALQAELAERDEREAELQQSIDRLLEQHRRLMSEVRTPQPASNWFEGANQTLAQLAANPEPAACKIMEAALVGLLQRAIALGAGRP
jgi:hypothetical protein